MNSIIEEFKQYVKKEIKTYKVSSEIHEVLEYVLISNGKYIRPLLFLCYLKDRNIDYKKYFNIAMAIEMMHTYSLIHDDLPALDNDDLRRGKLSCHKKFGEDVAVLSGDMLLTNSFAKLIENSDLDSSKKISLIEETVEAAGINGMINGQYMDIKNLVGGIDSLNEMHILKTSKMITLPLLLANIICEDKLREYLYNLGENVGLLYQIQDDYLDVYGDSEMLGKTLNKDREAKKKNYTYYYNKVELEDILQIKEKEIKEKILKIKDLEETSKVILNILKREK